MTSRTGYTTLLVLVTGMLALPGIIRAAAADEQVKQTKESRYMGKPTSYWIGKLDRADVKVRKEAIEALLWIGPEEGKTVPALAKALHDDDASVCLAVLDALGQIGTQAAIPPLLEALKDKNTQYRRGAIVALGNVGLREEKVVSALAKELLNLRGYYSPHYGTLRQDALEALQKIGPAAIKACVPDLLRAIKKPVPSDRSDQHQYKYFPQHVVDSLRTLRHEAVPALIQILNDKEIHAIAYHDIRIHAAQVLEAVGPAAKAAVPALTEALKDHSEEFREAARSALAQINKK